VSAENQKTADERISLLLQTPAAVRFLSAEPLLGPVDLTKIAGINSLAAVVHSAAEGKVLTSLDWVICGGESGPGARPMHPDWARSLRDQCKDAGVPFFFKQWGEFLPSDVPFAVMNSKCTEAGKRTPPMTFLPNEPREGLLRTGKTKDIDLREALLGR